jgi:hypothetical protein
MTRTKFMPREHSISWLVPRRFTIYASPNIRRAALLCFLSLTLTAADLPVVATAQYDNARTGANLHELKLTPSTVGSPRFGKQLVFRVDGDVNAQPLYIPSVKIPGRGVHNVVYVATEHDSVYAFDASGTATEPLWVLHLTGPGVAPADAHTLSCSFIAPEAGIVSTPVIDPDSRTMYFIARTAEDTSGTTRYYQRLHAVDIATGAERPGSPVLIRAAVKGSALFGLTEREVTFNSVLESPRAALLLANGNVYIAWGSQCDAGDYYGWVLSYDTGTLRQTGIFNTAPDGGASAIWQAGAGMAADSDGSIYAITGNGPFGNRDYGDTVLKFAPGLKIRDSFTPSNQLRLKLTDRDLGSTGPVLLPDHLMLAGGKEGVVYLLDRNHLGQALQTISLAGGIFGAPAFWNNHIYYFASDDVLKEFALTNRRLSAQPEHQASDRFHNPGAIPVVSADGNHNGIVWIVLTKSMGQHGVEAVLQAYDAVNVSHLLYSSAKANENPGEALRLTMPLIADGRVYVPSHNGVYVYGLK